MNLIEFNTLTVHAVHASIRNVAIEIQHNLKAALPIIASSTLESLSLALQALIDARLPHGQVRPVGLFMTRAVMLHETPLTQSSSAASVSWKG